MRQSPLALSYTFSQLWNDHASFSLWQSILIPTVLFVFALIIAAAVSYAIWSSIVEILSPSRTLEKGLKKELKNASIPDKIWLYRIIKRQKGKRKVVWFYWAVYLMNLLNIALLPLSYVSSMLTRGAGWALCCLLLVPYFVSLGSAGILFIPDLLFVPSERRRYFKK